MARHPLSLVGLRLVALVAFSLLVSGALLLADLPLLAMLAFFPTLIGSGAYLLGESSDLPGTTGAGDKNVP
jgi:hypothetical protein